MKKLFFAVLLAAATCANAQDTISTRQKYEVCQVVAYAIPASRKFEVHVDYGEGVSRKSVVKNEKGSIKQSVAYVIAELLSDGWKIETSYTGPQGGPMAAFILLSRPIPANALESTSDSIGPLSSPGSNIE